MLVTLSQFRSLVWSDYTFCKLYCFLLVVSCFFLLGLVIFNHILFIALENLFVEVLKAQNEDAFLPRNLTFAFTRHWGHYQYRTASYSVHGLGCSGFPRWWEFIPLIHSGTLPPFSLDLLDEEWGATFGLPLLRAYSPLGSQLRMRRIFFSFFHFDFCASCPIKHPRN